MLKAFRMLRYYPGYTLVGAIILVLTIYGNYILISRSGWWAIASIVISVLVWVFFLTSIHPQARLQGRLITNIPPSWTQNSKPSAYLTFDDGPNLTYTSQVLRILSDFGVRATFFPIGINIERAPEMIAEMERERHTIGNHSYDHQTFIFRSRNFIEMEIRRTEEAIIKAGGKKPTLFRFPHGFKSFRAIQIIKEMGYKIISWNIMPGDWLGLMSDEIVDYIIKNTKDGDIILLHDGHDTRPDPDRTQTVKALPHIIEGLLDRGFSLKCLGEVLNGRENE
ncbi:MAG: hypothetical protein B6D57_00915 [Candidatus Coatesbacteria bacterium 4484_99]|uniref:NodB homology domain-containing protein n=1 Tax=Candidatus Coatesbacteria bacterium 4484_99 TaxID=1970774 RepID=A0A1W9S2T7_9BACT|nr:MAG: hypothetical protein B6D57_00915 [Candidatus Coatesbacteria bacterium 4484_99]